MDSMFASLALTPPWREERLIIVLATDAIRCCRDGAFVAVLRQQVDAMLTSLGRQDMVAVRAFVSRARLSGLSLAALDDHDVLGVLRKSVKARDLTLLREVDDDRGSAGDATVEQRRLVRAIDDKTRRKLTFSGSQYRLVADVDLGKLPDRDSYQVVRKEEAERVLDGVAKQSGPEAAELPRLLTQARNKLTRDWRPPLSPDGLILLRRNIVAQATGQDTEPAITPSQMKKLVSKSDWIEIEVVDEDGAPYAGPYRLELTDGSVKSGNFNGFFGNHDLDSGTCKISFRARALPANDSKPIADELSPNVEAKPDSNDTSSDLTTSKLRFKLLDLLAKPVTGAAVTVAGAALTTDGDGLVEADVKPGVGTISTTLPSGDVGLSVGALSPVEDGTGVKIRLFNLGFLWDPGAQESDDEMVFALQDFQAQYHIDISGQLDDATKAKLVEVYGC
jgi:hypothetical protein